MNQKVAHEFSFQELEYYGKNNRVQMPEDLILLKVFDKDRQLLLQVNDFDNFEHIPDLVDEELEELQLKGKENRISLCERQFQRIVNFFNDLKLDKYSNEDCISKIQDYLNNIIQKNKAIKKLEQEEFSPCCYKLTMKDFDDINTPLETFPEISLIEKKKSQNRLIWTSVTLISLSAMFLIVWYFKPQNQNQQQNNIEELSISLPNNI